ncbi:phage tail sheath family protein [Paenibacillus xylanexedens]|uniref:phage tail sheath family protein n=1 Tax=Paenibacillus xylanexedens TaxID=528191 RepID=UPI001F15F935|nr:phage tail sheath family protein [Paenibacillus xylanexedens]MCF7753372.1 phage tail sheath family protein [Paenibacillus xylanexedens]
MAYSHGITAKEKTYSPPAQEREQFTGIVVVGTAPVNMSTRVAPLSTPVNVPILARNWDEAVAALGYSDDWESFTLCEVMKSQFQNHQTTPVTFINVLDPAVHTTEVEDQLVSVVKGRAIVDAVGITLASLVVKSADGTTTYTGTDYSASYNNDGKVQIVVRSAGTIPPGANSLSVTYDKLDNSLVNITDIIGGTDVTTGKRTGLELTEEVYQRFQVIPDVLIAPGFSTNPIVAFAMVDKARKINGVFEAQAIIDLDASVPFVDIVDWKQSQGFTDPLLIAGYPKATYLDEVYHMSTIIASTMASTDADNDGVPAESPSNKAAMIDGLVYEDGTELYLGKEQAEILNGNGIVTALNFTGEYTVWGSRTTAYPMYTDPQRTFIPVRRMFTWAKNNFIARYWPRVDSRMIRRNIASIVDDANVWFNGLQASGYLLGGLVTFDESKNKLDDLINGKVIFGFRMTPPSPMEDIQGEFEYDTSYIASVFA